MATPTSTFAFKELSLKQYLIRVNEGKVAGQIDNGTLWAGAPMYFYCQACGIHVASLPEDYLFHPPALCCQCQGLQHQEWLEEAKNQNSLTTWVKNARSQT